MSPLWRRGRWSEALREFRRHQVAEAQRLGYCCCPAGEMGAAAGEEHESWCGAYRRGELT